MATATKLALKPKKKRVRITFRDDGKKKRISFPEDFTWFQFMNLLRENFNIPSDVKLALQDGGCFNKESKDKCCYHLHTKKSHKQ